MLAVISWIRRPLALSLMCAISTAQVAAGALAVTIEYEAPFGEDAPQDVDITSDVYIIGPGDVLELKVFGAEELSGPLTVLSDGSVSFPYLGSVRLAGLTLQQAMLWTRELLSKELLRADLQLTVTRPRPMHISIIGQVQRPGLYTLGDTAGSSSGGAGSEGVGGATSGLPTLVSAIQTAGGITQQASLRDVVLQRRMPGLEPRYKMQRLNLFPCYLTAISVKIPTYLMVM